MGPGALSEVLAGLNLPKSVGDDGVTSLFDVGFFPIEFPFLDLCAGMENAKVHGTHIERAEFGLGHKRCGKPVLDAHAEGAAGGDVDYGIAVLLDARQELHEDCRVWRGPAGFWIARMQMDDGGPGLGGGNRFPGDFIGRNWKIGCHAWGVDRTGDRASNDHLSDL